MIRSFRDVDTECLAQGTYVRRFNGIAGAESERLARRKLRQVRRLPVALTTCASHLAIAWRP